MFQNFFRTKRMLAVLCLLVACLGALTPAFAQLDYDTYDIFQNGIAVGAIYVPQRAPNQPIYAEYWILSSRYVYPSEKNPVATEIKSAAGHHYTSLADFFTNVPWGEGYRFVTVVAYDSAVLPGRTATTLK